MKKSYATEPICDVKRPNFKPKNTVHDDWGLMGTQCHEYQLSHWSSESGNLQGQRILKKDEVQ